MKACVLSSLLSVLMFAFFKVAIEVAIPDLQLKLGLLLNFKIKIDSFKNEQEKCERNRGLLKS